MNEPKRGFGKKDGSQQGRELGGIGRNRTDECRHPSIKTKRKEGGEKIIDESYEAYKKLWDLEDYEIFEEEIEIEE